jgi:hypothetical protein
VSPWSHPPTAVVGLALLVGLLMLRRVAPLVPGALVAVIAGIAAVAIFDLRELGVAVTGALPSGLPAPHFAVFEPATYRSLFHDAAAIVLISFASGMLTAKSFARRNRYEIDANQELIAFGASNIASGLAQGFPVTGADSRTAVNNAVGGKTQLVGVVAAATTLFALAFQAPLAQLPTLGGLFCRGHGLFDVTGHASRAMSYARVSRRSARRSGSWCWGPARRHDAVVFAHLAADGAPRPRMRCRSRARPPRLQGGLSRGADRPGPAALPLRSRPRILQRRPFR